MSDPNKKRYVYLDKYIENQAHIMKKLNTNETRITALSFIVMGLITITSFILYKIFE